MRGNLAGWMLTHNQLLGLLPGPQRLPESAWQQMRWSSLWPRYSFADVMGRTDWSSMPSAGAGQSFMTPYGAEVQVQTLDERRCRVEIRYRFYEWVGLN